MCYNIIIKQILKNERMINMHDIRKDDIILFVKGNNERPIGYTLSGKVILCKNDITLGYAKVKSVEEREKVILVEAENVFI